MAAESASGRIKRYFYLAAKEATLSEMKYRHGAVLVRGGRLIAKGFNHYRRTPHSMSTHAEMAALNDLREGKEERKLLARGSDIFVVRLGGRAIEPLESIWKRNSRPCPVCVEKLYQHGVKRVFYTVGQPSHRYFTDSRVNMINDTEDCDESDEDNEELKELMAVGEDGKEIRTCAERDLQDLLKFEEQGAQEGWWMEKVEDLKAKMEAILKFDLARYKHKQCDHDPIPFKKEVSALQ